MDLATAILTHSLLGLGVFLLTKRREKEKIFKMINQILVIINKRIDDKKTLDEIGEKISRYLSRLS